MSGLVLNIDLTLALACAGVLIPCVYIALLAIDATRLSRAIGPTGTARGQSAPISPITTLGCYLAGRLEGVSYRLNSLEWQVDALSEAKCNSHRAGKISQIAAAGSEIVSETKSCEQSLEEFGPRFRAHAAGIVIGRPRCAPVVVLRDGHGPRFTAELLKFTEHYLQNGERDIVGLQSSTADTGRGEGLAFFGIRNTVVVPFEWQEESGEARGLVFLGYRPPYEPTALELRWAEELAADLQLKLATSKRIMAAEAMAREKSDFLAHVSHDIRSPLNNIQGVLQLLRTEGMDSEAQELLDIAMSNCSAVRDQAESMLDYSKLRAGKLSAKPLTVSLDEAVKDVVNSYRVSARLKGIALSVDVAGQAAAKVDPQHLRRIVGNFVSNAIKFTEQGSISVAIRPKLLASGPGWEISVRDTGLGMEPEQMARLFTPFTRFHDEHTEGIGLGLALSKVLAELNGATLEVQSVPSQGSTFSISLRAEQASARGLRVLPGHGGGEVGEEPSVLLVDDDADCLSTLGRLLGRAGCKVLEARGIREAMRLVESEEPDAIITDVKMPDGGARSLLRALAESGRHIPVIVLSGSEISEAELAPFPVHAILEKPVAHDALLTELSELRESMAARLEVA